MESSYSPGPWKLNGDYVTNDVGGYIAKVLRVNHEDEANARLISAGPELLELAVRSRDRLHIERLDKNGQQLFRDLRAVIAKATGQDS